MPHPRHPRIQLQIYLAVAILGLTSFPLTVRVAFADSGGAVPLDLPREVGDVLDRALVSLRALGYTELDDLIRTRLDLPPDAARAAVGSGDVVEHRPGGLTFTSTRMIRGRLGGTEPESDIPIVRQLRIEDRGAPGRPDWKIFVRRNDPRGEEDHRLFVRADRDRLAADSKSVVGRIDRDGDGVLWTTLKSMRKTGEGNTWRHDSSASGIYTVMKNGDVIERSLTPRVRERSQTPRRVRAR